MRLIGFATICAMLALTVAGGISDSCRVFAAPIVVVVVVDTVVASNTGGIGGIAVIGPFSFVPEISMLFCWKAVSNRVAKFIVATGRSSSLCVPRGAPRTNAPEQHPSNSNATRCPTLVDITINFIVLPQDVCSFVCLFVCMLIGFAGLTNKSVAGFENDYRAPFCGKYRPQVVYTSNHFDCV